MPYLAYRTVMVPAVVGKVHQVPRKGHPIAKAFATWAEAVTQLDAWEEELLAHGWQHGLTVSGDRIELREFISNEREVQRFNYHSYQNEWRWCSDRKYLRIVYRTEDQLRRAKLPYLLPS